MEPAGLFHAEGMRLWAGTALAALGFGAALGLLEEGGEDAGEGDDEGDDEEDEAHGAPKGFVAGRARLLGDVAVSDAAGEQSEDGERGGEDVEVAAHELS